MVDGLLGQDSAALLIHRTTGKDRTGWATAVLLSALGVAPRGHLPQYLLATTICCRHSDGPFASSRAGRRRSGPAASAALASTRGISTSRSRRPSVWGGWTAISPDVWASTIRPRNAPGPVLA